MANLIDMICLQTGAIHNSHKGQIFFSDPKRNELSQESLFNFNNYTVVLLTAIKSVLVKSSYENLKSLSTIVNNWIKALEIEIGLIFKTSPPAMVDAIDIALASARELVQHSMDRPASLAGFLYAVETSQKADIHLQPRIFSFINSLELSFSQLDILIEGESFGFKNIADIQKKISYTNRPQLKFHPATTNAEAGLVAWQRFPYLKTLFAERGKKLIIRESGWAFLLKKELIDLTTGIGQVPS